MNLRRFSLALGAIVLAAAVACDAFARKGGRSGASGGWSGKGQGWQGKGHGGNNHYHRHIFLGAGFYGPWYWDPWWYTPRYPYYYPFAAPITFEQPYIEQYAIPLESGYWYYCHSAAVYYPGVAQCPEGWEQVAPHPAQEQ